MHLYGNGTWTQGYLDETPTPGNERIWVHRQIALAPVADQFFVRQPQVAMLVSYLRSIGPRRVVRKVISRRREAARVDAWLSAGLGTTASGDAVIFVVTSGPAGAERVVVPDELWFPAPDGALDLADAGHFEPSGSASTWSGVPEAVRKGLEPILGWRAASGLPVDLEPATRDALGAFVTATVPRSFAPVSPAPAPSEVCEHVVGAPPPGDRPTFHVFGYGQGAKTQAIPNLGARLALQGVHELDPLQIGPVGAGSDSPAGTGPSWDTSGLPRPGEVVANAVVASYHHTHAPIAISLLDSGARHVIIEKPAATTPEQIRDLVAALARNSQGRVHVSFQRRFSPFNPLLREDLGHGPISMASQVYEVPLPARHWYRWPSVGNEVVSNACHWIDYFLFLNPGADVVSLFARRLSTQVVLGVELDDGASFSMSLRHAGAPLRGVRDLCTFWREDATVTIEDQRSYRAERGYRVLRTRTTHPYQGLERMYAEFADRIIEDRPGDPVEALQRSVLTTLELARLLDEQ